MTEIEIALKAILRNQATILYGLSIIAESGTVGSPAFASEARRDATKTSILIGTLFTGNTTG